MLEFDAGLTGYFSELQIVGVNCVPRFAMSPVK